MLSRERKAELLADELRQAADTLEDLGHPKQAGYYRERRTLIEAIPEEACGEVDLNWAIRPIRPPKPISSDEGWREAVKALRKLGLPPEIVSEGRALAAVKAIVAASPTGLGEDSE